jgi:nitrogen fixation/metabolism regulation signal transduction histidine kinase
VRKIMEEHGGTITLLDPRVEQGGVGALVRLAFPLESQSAQPAAVAAAP